MSSLSKVKVSTFISTGFIISTGSIGFITSIGCIPGTMRISAGNIGWGCGSTPKPSHFNIQNIFEIWKFTVIMFWNNDETPIVWIFLFRTQPSSSEATCAISPGKNSKAIAQVVNAGSQVIDHFELVPAAATPQTWTSMSMSQCQLNIHMPKPRNPTNLQYDIGTLGTWHKMRGCTSSQSEMGFPALMNLWLPSPIIKKASQPKQTKQASQPKQ